MKIRLGFISNSSSSSFIVAFKQKERCLTCGRHFNNIIHQIERNNYEYINNEVYAIGEKDVLKYILDLPEFPFIEHDIEENKKESSKYDLANKVKDYVKKGYQVASISVDRCDDNLLEFIQNKENCEIIYKMYD